MTKKENEKTCDFCKTCVHCVEVDERKICKVEAVHISGQRCPEYKKEK